MIRPERDVRSVASEIRRLAAHGVREGLAGVSVSQDQVMLKIAEALEWVCGDENRFGQLIAGWRGDEAISRIVTRSKGGE